VRIGIDIAIEAGDWPDEPSLRALAERAIGAAMTEMRESPSPISSPQGRREISDGHGAELSLAFTDDTRIHRLNKDFRGKDRPTNVLSFPQESGPLLGDVILAAETVHREAALAGKPLEDHMAHLIIHGFLHLLGYDHEADADAEAMEALERAALMRLGISDPYAAA
jgi:probable rRNA maturation factor